MGERPGISPRSRLLLAVIAVALGGAVDTARRLTPDGRGYGTHEQLGWSPCWFMACTALPCPTCGMTTAWAHAARGRVAAAAAANAGGLASFALAVIAGPWLLASAALGRWLVGKPTPRAALGVASGVFVVTVLDWARRIIAG